MATSPNNQHDGDLTDEEFWDKRWSAITLPALIDERVRWQLAMADVCRRFLKADPTRAIFEVGCAPGRWLVWFHKNFGYTAFGCDLSRRAAETTRSNLKINGVPGEIYTADIRSGRELPEHLYDVVVSIGVIEHFGDPALVVQRHVELLKPGGTLILNVPNLAGRINHWLLRAARMHSLIDVHNLTMMNKATFRSFAKSMNLEICYLEYVGGFDPGLMVYNHSYTSKWKRPPVFFVLALLERDHKAVAEARHGPQSCVVQQYAGRRLSEKTSVTTPVSACSEDLAS